MDPAARQNVRLNCGADLQGFRQALRIMVWSEIPPGQISWNAGSCRFGSQAPAAYGAAGKPIILPRRVGEMIEMVVCHSDPEKYARLYEFVWRMTHGERRLPAARDDPLVQNLDQMIRRVRTDLDRMRASLRFQQINDKQVGDRFVAWFEPEHYIVEAAAQFFVERFGLLDWMVLTPKGSLHWDRKELFIGPPTMCCDGRVSEISESGWRSIREKHLQFREDGSFGAGTP